MNTKVMLNKLAKRFPKRYAKLYCDHVGLMTGKLPTEVKKIMLCLDCDESLVPLIKKVKPDLIMTHHPFIYGTRAHVFKTDPYRKALCEEIDSLGIPVYSLHTNFDTGRGGMNDALASALNLQNIRTPESNIMMRGGDLPQEMEVHEFAKYAVKCLNVDYSLLIASGKQYIKSVAIIGGGGGRDWTDAQKEGYDIYISGDAPHYVRRDVVNRKYNYLDMPHEIEKIFIPTMEKLLHEMDKDLEIICVDHEKLPEVIF